MSDKLIIREGLLKAAELNLSTLFRALNPLMEKGVEPSRGDIFSLSIMAMNVSGSLRNIRAAAQEPAQDHALQHRVMAAMKPVCVEIGLTIQQYKMISIAALRLVQSEAERAIADTIEELYHAQVEAVKKAEIEAEEE